MQTEEFFTAIESTETSVPERIKIIREIALKEYRNTDKELVQFSQDFGAHQIVGTGLGRMPLDVVFSHLSDLTRYFDDVESTDYGGSKDIIAGLSLENSPTGEELTHTSYYALQTLYSAITYRELERVVNDKDITLEEAIETVTN